MIRLIDTTELDILKDDPVRPHLEKLGAGKQVYVLDDLSAVICIAYTNSVPTDEKQLEYYTQAACQDGQHGSIAVAYTVWSNKTGAGKDIIFAVRDLFLADPRINRLVTLSPKTEMAKRFLRKNGARVLNDNADSYNFEYQL